MIVTDPFVNRMATYYAFMKEFGALPESVEKMKYVHVEAFKIIMETINMKNSVV